MKQSLFILLMFSSFFISAQTTGDFKTKLGDQVPEFSFETLDGKKMTSKDLEGKIVLLNFWATWCSPCVKEMPELNTFVGEMDPEKFVVVALAREQDKATVQSFSDKNGYDFTFASDLEKSVYSNFAEKSIPRNVVLDANGKIIFQLLGYYPEKIKEMEKLISAEVAKL